MTLEEAKSRLDERLDELAGAGFHIWGWDDESIQISEGSGGRSTSCEPRHPSPAD